MSWIKVADKFSFADKFIIARVEHELKTAHNIIINDSNESYWFIINDSSIRSTF